MRLLLIFGSLGVSLSACAAEGVDTGNVKEFNLDEVPHYKPEQEVAGTIRNFGFGLGGVRTWDQLGLAGDWVRKEIHTYGHAPSGTARFFQWKVLGNGDKWNPNFREYVESGSKMIADEDRAEQRLGLQSMLRNELARDRYGIAWTVVPQAKGVAGIKLVAIAPREGGAYVLPSRKTFQDRTYPLVRSIYIYLNRAPGKPLDPKLKEFLRYVLSREGQATVASNGSYLPLTGSVVREQLRKLE